MVGGKDQAEEVSHRLTLALNHIGIRVNQIEAFARLKKGAQSCNMVRQNACLLR